MLLTLGEWLPARVCCDRTRGGPAPQTLLRREAVTTNTSGCRFRRKSAVIITDYFVHLLRRCQAESLHVPVIDQSNDLRVKAGGL